MTARHEVAAVLADELCWTLTDAASPWPSSDDAITVAAEALRTLDDEVAVAVIESLAVALADVREQLHATQANTSILLETLHREYRENARLKARLVELLDARSAVSLSFKESETP